MVLVVSLAIIFSMILLTILFYDGFVLKHNFKLEEEASRTQAIVSNLFPRTIRERCVGKRASVAVLYQNVPSAYKVFSCVYAVC